MLNFRKVFVLLLALAILLPCVPGSAAPASFSDIEGHWAGAAILRWSEMGVLNGYPDGTFRPNNTVTRGELAAIINKLMHFPEVPGPIGLFTDLEGKWYASDVNALALQGAYLVTHGEAKGDAALSREEAAAMIFNSFPVSFPKYPNRFTDSDSMNSNYVDKINTMYNAGFLSGFPDGSFHPNEPITRAQVVTILDNMIDEYITEPGVYDNLESKSVLVAVPGVEIDISQNMSYLAVSPQAAAGKTVVSKGARFATLWCYDAPSASFGVTPNSMERKYLQSYDSRFAGGSGMEDFPYLISSRTQLALLGEYIGQKYKDRYFALANDIALDSPWTPIGYYNSRIDLPIAGFQASFDGKGHVITGMLIDTDNRKDEATGLFAYIEGGSVRNLTVSGDISFSATTQTSIAGGICGYLQSGVIDNAISHVNITVNASKATSVGGITGYAYGRVIISNCQANGNIKMSALNTDDGNNACAGGIIGSAYSWGSIENCVSRAAISADAYNNTSAGGIAGFLTQNVSIINCQAYNEIKAAYSGTGSKGAYAGGIAGVIRSIKSVQGCVSYASVFASSTGTAEAGGIAAYIDDSFYNMVSIDSCQSFGDIKAVSTGQTEPYSANAGGIAGLALCANITNCFSDSNVTSAGGYHSSAGGVASNVGSAGDPQCRSAIKGCGAIGKVHADGGNFQNNAGGLTGQVWNSTIDNCWANAEVSVGKNEGSINVAGGFSSGVYLGGIVRNCYATGTVSDYGIPFLPMSGSFTGRLEGSVINCYATGNTTLFPGSEGEIYSYNTIVGSRRGNGGIITQCADLTANDTGNPFIINEPIGMDPKITVLSPDQTYQSKTYTAIGWDFDAVWIMPETTDSFKLPILRGVFETEQRALNMPEHLG